MKKFEELLKYVLGYLADEDHNVLTYDHMLPPGTGDDFSQEQIARLIKVAKEDKDFLTNNGLEVTIDFDDNFLPYLEVE